MVRGKQAYQGLHVTLGIAALLLKLDVFSSTTSLVNSKKLTAQHHQDAKNNPCAFSSTTQSIEETNANH